MKRPLDRRFIMFVGALLLALCTHGQAAGDSDHPHHVAAETGIASHNGKTSGFLGIDYLYTFSGPWSAGVFYEEVSGDFDLRAWGAILSHNFGNGWKVLGGIGAEFKIDKDKTPALVHIGTGYDWHFGSWSLGPAATVDFIEGGEQTYSGVALGYGF